MGPHGLKDTGCVMMPSLFSTENFMPHGHCFFWRPDILFLHVGSDALIAMAYISIPIVLILFTRKVEDLPFSWVYALFSLFILSCGLTHIFSIVGMWKPVYWAEGAMKAFTALASVATAAILPFQIPRAIALSKEARLSRRREHELRESNRRLEGLVERLMEMEEAKKTFVSNISHELRTPLTLLLGPLETLRSSETDAARRHALETSGRNARQLLRLVEDLLEVAKTEVGGTTPLHEKPFELLAFSKRICAAFDWHAQERGIAFEAVGEEVVVRADDGKIERVLCNLLSNAFKHCPDDGIVKVEVTRSPEAPGLVRIDVGDSGPGIPSRERVIVFERFRQGAGAHQRHKGTGLGLAIAKHYVEIHGGSIEALESPLGGALIRVTLPVERGHRLGGLGGLGVPRTPDTPQGPAHDDAEWPPSRLATPALPYASLLAADLKARARVSAHETSDAPPHATSSGEGDGFKVLVVEDDPDMGSYVKGVLASRGPVTLARSAEEAHRTLAWFTPDLIVSDLMLPGESGEDFIAKLRAHAKYANTPVLVLSAKADSFGRIELLRSHVQDYMVKPFDGAELTSRCENLLKQASALSILRSTLASQSDDVSFLAKALAERSSQLAAATRAREEFLGLVSHELRTPLSALLGWISLLQSDAFPLHQTREVAAKLDKQGQRLLELINSILDVSRIVTGRMRIDLSALEFEDVIDRAVEGLRATADAKGVALVWDRPLEPGPGPLQGDADRLFRCVHELVNNAIKFTPKGGNVTLTLERIRSEVCLKVVDSGEGIDPRFLPSVFEAFRQEDASSRRRHAGLGLGLSIVKGIVELHGGEVRVTSEGRGLGTRAEMHLPLLAVRLPVGRQVPTKRSTPHAKASLPPRGERLSGFQILVVDDNPSACDLLQAMLEFEGAEVVSALSVAGAREALGSLPFDAVLTDISMPHEDGHALLSWVRANLTDRPDLPILALTASAVEVARLRDASGFRRVLGKPVDLETLIEALSSEVHRVRELRSSRSP